MTHFSHFSGQERFEGATKMRENDKKHQTCQKTSQTNTQVAHKTRQNKPKLPQVSLEILDFDMSRKNAKSVISAFMTHFSHFSGQERFEGAENMTKNDK